MVSIDNVEGSVAARDINVEAEYSAVRDLNISYSGLGGLVALLPRLGFSNPEHKRKERMARIHVLELVRSYWIDPALKADHEFAPIDIRLASRPEAVQDRLRRVASGSTQPEHALPSAATIKSVYDDSAGHLLILGEPGAGKTRIVAELADELVELASSKSEQPLPVIFHLSTWAAGQRLSDWLLAELANLYGVREVGRDWIKYDRLILLLDGLDEVSADHRDACVEAINAFHAVHPLVPITVCCRSADYGSLNRKLHLRAAIVVKPLTEEELDAHLKRLGLREAARSDPQLRELLTTPLFLRSAAIAYRGQPAQAIVGEEPAMPGKRVIADYVEAMFARQRPGVGMRWTQAQTTEGLSWLAREMKVHEEKESGQVFRLECLQASWLRDSSHRSLLSLLVLSALVLASIGIAALIVVGAELLSIVMLSLGWENLPPMSGKVAGVFAVHIQLPRDFWPAFVYAASVGAMAGIALAWVGYNSETTNARRIMWPKITTVLGSFGVMLVITGVPLAAASAGLSWLVLPHLDAQLNRALPSANALLLPIANSAVFGLTGLALWFLLTQRLDGAMWKISWFFVSGLVIGSRYAASGQVQDAVIGAIELAVLIAVAIGLISGFWTETVESRLPGDGIRVLIRNTLVVGSVTLLVAAPLAGLYGGIYLLNGRHSGFFNGLYAAVLLGAVVTFLAAADQGAIQWLRHQILRRLLVSEGSIPPDFVRFLDHAVSLILLRRRGGEYQFVHSYVLEYFARAGVASG